MSREYILKAVNSKFGIEIETFSKYSFEKRDIKIVAAGAMNRVGTTTTAMNMANFLAKSGAKPYEITELVKSLKLIDNMDLDIVLQIVPENERQNIRKILSVN